MKKFLRTLFALTLVAALAACSTTKNESEVENNESETTSEETEAPESIKLMNYNGAGEAVEVEYPYNPKKIAVMDYAALDILDAIGATDAIVGVSKGSSIDYIAEYMNNDYLLNLGTIKTADLEAVMEAEPDVIFIGGRLSSIYDDLAAIAPVYLVKTDAELGVYESTIKNATAIASMFGKEDQVAELAASYESRIAALKSAAEGKSAVLGMVTSGGFNVLGNTGRCSLIVNEVGFTNAGAEYADSASKESAHGNEASFEFLVSANPDYIFALDRDAAIGTEGAQLASEVLDNELVNSTEAAKNGNVVVLEHSNIWYTAEGGITALGLMLEDLEATLIK